MSSNVILPDQEPTVEETIKVQALLHNARCSKQVGIKLRELNKMDLSTLFLQLAMSQFCERYLHHPNTLIGSKMTALFEAIVIAVEYTMEHSVECSEGYTSFLPDEILLEVIHKELFCTMQTVVPFLPGKIRLQVAEFLFLSNGTPNSGLLSQFKVPGSLSWFFKNDVFSLALFTQFFRNTPQKCTLSLLNKATADCNNDDLCIVLFENFTGKLESHDAAKLIDIAIETRKAKTTACLIKRSQYFNNLNVVYKVFDKQKFNIFLDHCSPQMRRELLEIVIISGDPQRIVLSAVDAILRSGEMHTKNDLNFKEIIESSLALILAQPELLERLFDVGFHITHKKDVIRLVFQTKCAGTIHQRAVVSSILIKNGASINGLKYACSHKNGTAIEGATELAVKTNDSSILELVLKHSKRKETCDELMEKFKQKANSDSKIEKKKDINHQQVKRAAFDEAKLVKLIDEMLKKPNDYFTNEAKVVVNGDDDDDEDEQEMEEDDEGDNVGSIESATPNLEVNNDPAEPVAGLEEEFITEDDAFSTLPWTVLISKQAADFLKAKKTSKSMIKDIRSKLYTLAQGNRTDHAPCHRLIQSENKLCEAYVYRGSRIIWQEAIEYSEKLSVELKRDVYTDVIKVLWITTKHSTTQLNNVLQRIKTSLNKSSSAISRRNLEIHSQPPPNNSIKMPRIFLSTLNKNEIVHDEAPQQRPMPNVFEGEYSLMQFHPFSDFLDTYLNDNKANFDTPICMSPQEHEIIKLEYGKVPIILCGRSGTGKTTTCIYRMWNEFKAFCEKKDENDDYLHQSFITKSPVLCSQVKKNFKKLVNGMQKIKRLWVSCKTSDYKKFQDVKDINYPLFLTSRQFLILLDNSLPDPFFPRDSNGDLNVNIVNSDYDQNADPEALFTDIENNNDNELNISNKPKWTEVTADFFCTKIWPSMKTKKYFKDPLLVWMEIQSFIKGSIGSLKNEPGFLSEDEYLQFGAKAAPTFTPDDRSKVYECFIDYRKICQNHASRYDCVHLFDECDLIHNLFHRIAKQKHDFQPFLHHVYIDEVQDFTQAELCLFFKCSRNPQGTFCTGDTAQSIIKGVFFRFSDLKSQFWEMIHQSQDSKIVPELKVLSDNFRAHSGIIDMAQSVIDIMKQTFKTSFHENSISEKAVFKGPKPILLEGHTTDGLTSILLGNTDESIHLEMGAHQAILVRSEACKQKLPESLKNGIVLTVIEAKGLEFNDVLLYNFFFDSEVEKEWRLFYNHLNEGDQVHPLRADEVQERSLKSLLAELKCLYTAITRAKVNLWIYDSSRKSQPAFHFWQSRNLANLFTNDDDASNDQGENLLFAAPSEKEQWAKQGDYYFRVRRWNLAKICYEKAGMIHQMNITKAYELVEKAITLPVSDAVYCYKEASLAFLETDDVSHRVDYIKKAALCLSKGRLHELSAKLYEKMNEMKKAASEWSKSDNHREYARVLEELEDHSGAVATLLKSEDYKVALQKAVQFEKNGIKLRPAVTSQQIASEYVAHHISKETEKEDLKHVLMQYVSDGTVKADFLKKIGLYFEAAKEHSNEGQYKEAYRVLKAQNLFSDAVYIPQEINDKEMFDLLSIRNEMYFPKTRLEDFNFSDSYVKAFAQMLYAFINENISFFQKAINLFCEKSCSCSAGAVMAYHSRFNMLGSDSRTDVVEVFEMCRYATSAKESVTAISNNNATHKQKSIFKDILKLNNIEDDPQCYFVPALTLASNSFDLTGLNLNPAEYGRDIDGMVMLDKQKVHDLMIAAYTQMIYSWLSRKDVYDFILSLIKKLHSYKFHSQLCEESFHVTISASLDKYFKDVMTILEYHKLCPDCSLPGLNDVHKASLSLFSFNCFSSHLNSHDFIVQVTQDDFHFRRSYFTDLALELIRQPNASLDDYFRAWTFLMIFSSIYSLQVEIKIKKKENSNLFLKYERETHIFFWWTYTWRKLVKENKIISAFKTIYTHFLSRLYELNESVISVHNVTFILSIFSTLLISTASNNYAYGGLIIPELYYKLCQTFDALNRKKYHESILSSPYYNTDRIYIDTAIDQIHMILLFILGTDNENGQNILKKVLSSHQSLVDGCASDCLVLCLVLVINLYAIYYVSRHRWSCDDAQMLLLSIQKELNYCQKLHPINIPFVEEAFQALQRANNLGDVLNVVVQLLESKKQTSQMINVAYPNFNNDHYARQFLASIRIKRLVILESEDEMKDQTSIIQPVAFTNQISDEHYEEIHEDDNEEITQDEDKKLIDIDGTCIACGITIDSDEVQIDSHLNSTKHKNNLSKYQEWEETLKEAHCYNEKLLKILNEKDKLFAFQSIKSRSQSDFKNVLEQMDECQLKYDWIKCTGLLVKYTHRVKSGYLKEIQKISEENKPTTMEDIEEEKEEELIVPNETLKKWTK